MGSPARLVLIAVLQLVPMPTLADGMKGMDSEQWIAGLHATREGALDVARAHLAVLALLDVRVLAAEYAMVCRAVELAEKDARIRTRVSTSSPAGRMRTALLPRVVEQFRSREVCTARNGASTEDLPRKLDRAVALLDLPSSSVAPVERVLREHKADEQAFEEAFLELSDWVSRHDELVKKLAAMNLALRHAWHGHQNGHGERLFEALREKVEGPEE